MPGNPGVMENACLLMEGIAAISKVNAESVLSSGPSFSVSQDFKIQRWWASFMEKKMDVSSILGPRWFCEAKYAERALHCSDKSDLMAISSGSLLLYVVLFPYEG